MATTGGDGKVAVHRWFAAGEGWATHPWFAGREPLYDALRPQLQGADGEFCVPGLGGVLVGEKVPDPDCPDPKARPRHPTILRVVFVAEEPTARQRADLLRKLRALEPPPAAGEFPGLEIPIPARRPPRRGAAKADDGPPPATEGTPFSPKALAVGAGVVAGVLLLVGGGLVALSGLFSGPPTGPTTAAPPTKPTEPVPPPLAGAPDGDLTPVQGEVPYLLERTRGRFLQQIGSAGVYDHPYVAYLSDTAAWLPEAAPRCQTPEDVRQGLRQLLDTLRPGEAADTWGSDRLKDAIDQALSYEAWRRGPGSREYRDRRKPLPAALRRFVERQRHPDGPLAEALAVLAGLLREWGEPVQSGRPTLAVADRFFAALARPAGLPSPLELDHPKVAFLARLPAEPVAAGQTFDSEMDLTVALRRLLVVLDADAHPGPATGLAARVGRAMSYAEWKQAQPETFRDANAELPPEVAKACRRFER